ncbi:MAG: HAD-IB family hydrolase [Actinobacteria bacterium]|nr:MAG: HAD-IB family hydrolase [Actinomycetota bacterium]
MGSAAAFFDLDRTLLRGASGPLLTEALVAAGVAPDRRLPGQGLLYKTYEILGETLFSMALARQAVRVVEGWSPTIVREAAEQAADRLVDDVLPYARVLIDEHRAAGRPAILATTTPYDLVAPLARRLDFDDVVATRYAEADGRYTGRIDGEFVWFTGKLAAVRRWADANGVSVAESWAYSDSVYDVPLLSSVAHPHAVNPDPRLRLVAAARRWPVVHLDVPPGVRKVAGVEPFDVLRLLARPELIPFARFDIGGTEGIPADGPGIVVANHRSYFDTVAVGLTVARSGRALRFLGKKEVFDAPIVGQLARALGGIRVERGSGSDEPLREAARALEAGELVAMMPQGTIPRGRAFFDPDLKGRWGAARLARLTHAPVVPIGLWGTESVWPRNARVPNVLNVTNPPLVRTRVGDEVPLAYDDLDDDTRTIMEAITGLLPPEARVRREPTPDELARTLPAGYRGDPDAETERRPGSD